MTEKYDQAETDYMAGMKYKDIASKYKVSLNTVKTWKRRYGWQRGAPKKGAPPKPKGVHTKLKKGAHKVAPKIVDELEANDELTDKQKSFCLFYLQRFNATWAYQQAYECDYDSARTNGPRMLANACIKDQLTKLKKQQRADLFVTAEDIANQYAKQAFADLGDYVDFGTKEEIVRDGWHAPVKDKVKGGYLKEERSFVHLKNKADVDTTLIKGVRIGRDGVVVELYDKQKALDGLAKIMKNDDKTDQTPGLTIVDSWKQEGADDD